MAEPLFFSSAQLAERVIGVSRAQFLARPHGLRWHKAAPQPVQLHPGGRPKHYAPAWREFLDKLAAESCAAPTAFPPVTPKRTGGRPRKQPVGAHPQATGC